MVGDKWSCSSTTGDGRQNWCLHLKISSVIQVISDGRNDSRSLDHLFLHIWIHDEIHFSLTVSDVCVHQAMPLVWQRLQCLGNELKALDFQRHFSGFCDKDISFYTDPVSQIKSLEELQLFFSHVVQLHIKLQLSFTVVDIGETCFSLYSLSHESSSGLDMNAFQSFMVFLDFLGTMGHFHLIYIKRIFAILLKRLQLFASLQLLL